MKKGLVKNLLPDYRFKSITDINPDFFSGAGLVIFDVDNTLVFSETTETKKEIINWLNNIRSRYRCICLSNSRTILKREKRLSELFGCEVFLSRHKKPSKRLFLEIKNKYGIDEGKTFIVGDRIFSDILFGNRNGIITILVDPLGGRESIFIKIVRKIEEAALFIIKVLGYN